MTNSIKIAVDAMGGDGSPGKVIKGIIHHFNNNKETFYQIFGDINKKMKDYLNLFYGMIDKIHSWDTLDIESRNSILINFLDNSYNIEYLVKYFENYRLNLKNNTLNSYIKGVVRH